MSEVITLNSQSQAIKYLSKKDKHLSRLFEIIGEITYAPYSDDPYVFLLDTIVGQMLSSKVADIICDRLHQLCGEKVTAEKILALNTEDLRAVGISYSKCEYVKNLSSAVSTGELIFSDFQTMSDDDVFKKLTSIRGIGSWSAKMYLIFVLNRENILPFEDGAFLQSYSWLYKTDDIKKTSIKKRCLKWAPYSSIAARYLYKALDYGYTKKPFNSYK